MNEYKTRKIEKNIQRKHRIGNMKIRTVAIAVLSSVILFQARYSSSCSSWNDDHSK